MDPLDQPVQRDFWTTVSWLDEARCDRRPIKAVWTKDCVQDGRKVLLALKTSLIKKDILFPRPYHSIFHSMFSFIKRSLSSSALWLAAGSDVHCSQNCTQGMPLTKLVWTRTRAFATDVESSARLEQVLETVRFQAPFFGNELIQNQGRQPLLKFRMKQSLWLFLCCLSKKTQCLYSVRWRGSTSCFMWNLNRSCPSRGQEQPRLRKSSTFFMEDVHAFFGKNS